MTEPTGTAPLASYHLPRARQLLDAEGWRFDLSELARLLDLGGGTTIHVDGELAGLLTFTIYGPEAWIGNVVVDPAFRGRRLGERLVAAAVDDLEDRGVEVVRLYSVHAAERLYERLGFEAEGLVVALTLTKDAPRTKPDLEDLTDPREVAELDAEIFGTHRTHLLERLLADGHPGYVTRDKDGDATGYVVAKVAEGEGVSEIGPGIVCDDADVPHLLAAALAVCPPGPVELAVREENATVRAAAGDLGFRETFTACTMRRGPPRFGGDPSRQLALAGLEKG